MLTSTALIRVMQKRSCKLPVNLEGSVFAKNCIAKSQNRSCKHAVGGQTSVESASTPIRGFLIYFDGDIVKTRRRHDTQNDDTRQNDGRHIALA